MLDFSKSHFELFGLPTAFVIDAQALRERYRDLQRVVHPDRYSGASDQEKRLSMQAVTQVNEAFDILRDPLKRARYLLELSGVEMGPDHETTKDAGFLMQQMDLREELGDVRSSDDPLAAVQAFMDKVSRMISSCIAQMALDFETRDPARLEAVKDEVVKMQFLNKLHAEAERLEARLEDELS